MFASFHIFHFSVFCQKKFSDFFKWIGRAHYIMALVRMLLSSMGASPAVCALQQVIPLSTQPVRGLSQHSICQLTKESCQHIHTFLSAAYFSPSYPFLLTHTDSPLPTLSPHSSLHLTICHRFCITSLPSTPTICLAGCDYQTWPISSRYLLSFKILYSHMACLCLLCFSTSHCPKQEGINSLA